MNTFEWILSYLLPLGLGGMMLAMPALSRGNTFFAVTVPDDLPASDLGRIISRRYLAGTLIATILALVAVTLAWQFLSGETAIATAYLLGTLIVTFGSLAAFVHCRGQALRFSQATTTERQATLAPRERLGDIVPRPLWLHALPYLLLALSCLWLLMHWEQIPEPVFMPGQPEESAGKARTPGAVFGLPLVMLFCLLITHAVMPMGLLIRRLPGHPSRVQTINRMLLWIMGLVALLGGWNSLAVLYGADWITGTMGLIVNATLMLLVVVIPVAMLAGKGFSRPGRPDEGDQTPDDCWKLGMIYFNPADQAVWVEKRFGIGYTLNFARPVAWVIMAAFIIIPAALVILAIP